MARQNIIGNKYGRLTVIADAPPTKDRRGHKIRMVECVCDCWNHIICQLNAVKFGHKSFQKKIDMNFMIIM